VQEENEMDSEDEARQQEQIAALYAQDTEDDEEEEEDKEGGPETMEVEVPSTSGRATAAAVNARPSLAQDQEQQQRLQQQGGSISRPVEAAETAAVKMSPQFEKQRQQHGAEAGLSHGTGGGEDGGLQAWQSGEQDNVALLEAATQPLPMEVLQLHLQQKVQEPEVSELNGIGGVGAKVDGVEALIHDAAAPAAASVPTGGGFVSPQLSEDRLRVTGGADGQRAGELGTQSTGVGGVVMGEPASVAGGAAMAVNGDPLGLAGLAGGGDVPGSNPPTFKVRKKRR
jgi:hypothetical protein